MPRRLLKLWCNPSWNRLALVGMGWLWGGIGMNGRLATTGGRCAVPWVPTTRARRGPARYSSEAGGRVPPQTKRNTL